MPFIEKNIQYSNIQKVNHFYVGKNEMYGKGVDFFFGKNFFVISRYNPQIYSPPNVRGEMVFILGNNYPSNQGNTNWLSNGNKLNNLNLSPDGFYISTDFNISNLYYNENKPLYVTFDTFAQGYKITPELGYKVLKYNFNSYFSEQPWVLDEFKKFCFNNFFIK